MQETKRRRIVINLDPRRSAQTAVGGKRRRWPTILAVLAVIIIAVVAMGAVAGFFWWRHYQSTPPYSLAVLIDAAQRNDTASMNQFLDTDKIAGNLATAVTEKMRDRFGIPGGLIDPQKLDIAIPALLPQVKQHLTGEIDKSVKEMAAKTERRPFFITALTLPYVISIKTDGDVAKVVPSNQIPELTLARNGERWKLVAIKDDALIANTVDDFVKDLPAIGHQPSELTLFPKPRGRRK